nr:hypothetical protein [Tanacetum cinerariifolium]
MNSYTFMGLDDVEGEEISNHRAGAHERLVAAFFSDDPMYDATRFRKTFRMARPLFNQIVTAVTNHDSYFYNNFDCSGREGVSALIKCTSAIRQLAYGVNAALKDIYGPEYLRKPTVTDIEKLYRHHEEKHGFPEMLGSLDCMDWEWFGCPYAFKGKYVRRDHGYDANVSIRSKLHILQTIQPFIFDIDGRTLEFGMEDFCLISGFCFGKVEIDPKEEDHSEFLLRSATRDIINSKSVHTHVRTEVRHEVRVYNEVSIVVDKEEVHVRAVDKEDTSNRSKNVPVCGLDQQSMEGASQCMNVDEPYKNWNDVSNNFPVNGLDHQPLEGVSQCTILNDEIKSVVVDGLISLRSQDVGHISKNEEARDDPEFKVNENEEASHSNDPEFKVKENEEASQSDIFLSTQQVTELINNVFDTPLLSLNYDDACVSELIDTDQPFLVKSVLDDVHINSVVKDAEESENPRQKFPVSVPESVMVLFRDKNRMEMRWTFPWLDDSHLVQIKFWEKLVGRSHTKRGWLSSDHLDIWIEYLWQFRDPNADWVIASPYICDMLSRFEYPLYYVDGVKYDVPWFANNVKKVYFPINEKILTGLSHNIPLEVDDPISFALAYRERMIKFYWKYKMLQ